MEHGIVNDWNDMERIWQYIYSKDQLQTFAEEVRRSRILCYSINMVLDKIKTGSKYL